MEFPQAHSQEPMMAKDQRSSPAHNVNVAPPPIPSSGYRIPLAENSAFPIDLRPLFFDADGVSPVFMGSAIFPDSVHPCKIVPALDPKCMVPYGGREHHHHGRYVSYDTMTFGRLTILKTPVYMRNFRTCCHWTQIRWNSFALRTDKYPTDVDPLKADMKKTVGMLCSRNQRNRTHQSTLQVASYIMELLP